MTDYAILVLGVLHLRSDEHLTSIQIADYTQLAQTTIAKVIKSLALAGLVETRRGVKGGCQLITPADKMTVAQVIEAIEGPIALTACVDGAEEVCSCRQGCFMGGNWNQVNVALRQALHSVVLTDLFNPANAFLSPQSQHQPSQHQSSQHQPLKQEVH